MGERHEGNNHERPRRLKRRTASVRNTLFSYVGQAADAAVFLLLTPFLVRSLGLVEFGLWSLALALAEWLQLLDFGLREAVMKYAAAHQARSEADSVKRVADTALCFHLALGLIALVVGFALAWYAVPWMLDDPEQVRLASLALVLLVISGSISLPANLAGSLLEGLGRFDALNLLRIANALLRLTLIVIALQLGLGLVGVAAAELSARLVLHVLRWWVVFRVDRRILPWPRVSPDDRRALLRFGSWNALRQVGEVAISRVYEPVLAFFAGPPAIGAFYIGRRLGSMPAELIVPMTQVLFPLSSELEAAGRRETLRRTLLFTTKFSLVLTIPVTLVLTLGAHPILANWMGGRTPEAEPVLSVFAVVFLVVAASLPADAILLGLARTRLLALVVLGQGAITIGLGIPLIRQHGPVGLAVSALVAAVSLQFGVTVPAASRCCQLPLRTLFRRAAAPALIAAAPVAVGMYVLRDVVAPGGLAAIGAWAGAGAITYLALLWIFGFDTDEREFLRSHYRRLILPASRIDDFEDPI